MNTKKKSQKKKKTTKRLAPKEPAKEFNMNTIKKGLYKNEYIVAKKTNGTKYWKKLTKVEKNCRSNFDKKFKVNKDEYKKGKYVSIKQALAVTYNQVYKKNSKCKKYLDKRK